MKKLGFGGGWFVPVVFVLLGFDQASKWAVEGGRGMGQVIPGIFSLTLVHNTGVAFGMAQGNNLVTGLLALAILGVAGWVAKDWAWEKRWVQVVAGLIAGGAVGNLVDRVRVGHVIDFLDFHWRSWSWPAFNVADAAITVGVSWLVLAWLAGCSPDLPSGKKGLKDKGGSFHQ